MIRAATTSFALLAAILASRPALAASFVDIHFDGDTVGAQPGVAAASNPLLKPTGIGGYTATTSDSPPTAANGTLTVENVGGMNKAAQLVSNPSNNVLGALYLDTGFSQAGQKFALSFDLNIAHGSTSQLIQPKTLDGGGTVGLLFGMNAFGTALAPRFAVAPTGAGTGVFSIRSPDNTDLQSFFTYAEGQTYNVSLVADYDTGLVSTFVDGGFTGNKSFAAAGAAGVTTQEFFFFLNGNTGDANSVAIDNIVAAVPEPTTLAAIAGGAILLLGRRRRRA